MNTVNKKFYIALFGTSFFVQEAFIGPIMVAFYTTYLSLSFSQMTAFFSAILLTRTVSEIPCGVISDLMGRKKALILGEFLVLVAMCAVFALKLNSSFLTLLVIALVWGFGSALSSGNLTPLLYDMSVASGLEHKMQRLWTYAGSLSSLVVGVASILAGYLAAYQLSLPVIFDIVFAVFFILTALIYITPQAPSHLQVNIGLSVSSTIKVFLSELKQVNYRFLLPVGLVSGVFFGSTRAAFNFLQPLLDDHHIDIVFWGWISSGLFLISAVVGYAAGKLKVDLYKNVNVIFFTLLLSCASCLWLYLSSNSIFSIIGFFVFNGIVGILITPIIMTAVFSNTPKESNIKTTVFSILAFLQAACSAALQTLSGLFSTQYNHYAMVTTASVFCVLSIGVFLLINRLYTK